MLIKASLNLIYGVYRGTRNIEQLIRQAKIDVLGMSFEKNQNTIHGIDVAFHEFGLNYGLRDETVSRVMRSKKRKLY